MKKPLNIVMLVQLAIAFVLFSACEKDSNSSKPTLSVNDTIVGMTDIVNNIDIQAADADGDALEITLEMIVSPESSSPLVEIKGTSLITFSTTVAGLYKIEVTVDDGQGKSITKLVSLLIGGVLPTSISSNTVYPDLFENENYPDYYALQSVQVTAGLKLESGVVIENGADVRLWITGNSAYFTAEGAADNPIILRGVDKVKGSWQALHIASNNVNNKLDYVQIKHAGSSELSNQKAALLLQSNTSSKLSIKNTSISESAGHAFYVDGNSGNITDFANNNFSDNDGAPIRFGAENMYILDRASTFQNNGINAVEISSGGNPNVVFNTSGTIPALDIPYHIYSSLELRAQVIFESGVTCKFFTDMRVWVAPEGSIIANATSDPITFTGMNESPGSWFGFEIASPSPSNLINGAIISHAGNAGGRDANIYLFGSSPGSQLTINNSEISNSQTYGIWASSGSVVLNQSNNTFNNNASGNIRID